MKGDWALAEWYPNYKNKTKLGKEDKPETASTGKRKRGGRPKGSKNAPKESTAQPLTAVASA
jgi:hypothetical protein